MRSADEYAAVTNNLKLPSPKMMDVVVPANMTVGLKPDVLEGDCTIPAAHACDWFGRADVAFAYKSANVCDGPGV